MDLSGADPSTINAPDVHPLENRQHHGAGPHPEGRRPPGKGSPRGGREDPHAHQRQLRLLPAFIPTQTRRFFAWNATDNPEAIDALSQKWDFSLAYLFPPIPLLKRVIRKLESSRGTYLLVTPFWDAQTWFTSLQALAVEDVRRLPMSADLVIDLTTGEPPQNLERLFLVIWTISGGVGESMPSQIVHSISRQDGSDPQKTAMSARGSPSRTSSALPPFRSIRRL
jgi:hypothetical protein